MAVQQRDAHAFELQVAEQAVASLARAGELRRQMLSWSLIAIAEHEVRRPGGEQFDDGHRADVAAVQHGVDVEALEHPHRRPRELDVAVGIADNAESHGFYFNAFA